MLKFVLPRTPSGESSRTTVIDTCETVDWGPPLMDEDLHSICQALYKGVEGSEWENLYHTYVELHKSCQA